MLGALPSTKEAPWMFTDSMKDVLLQFFNQEKGRHLSRGVFRMSGGRG